MAKSKKTKTHKKIDGLLLQMNKTFSNLKMKQKDKITGWVFEKYKNMLQSMIKYLIYWQINRLLKLYLIR